MDKVLKQRLVGASVLVALAVVVLPMLLGGQPETPQGSRQIEIPPKPTELNFETRRFPIGDQAPDEPSEVPDDARTPATPPANAGQPDPAAGSGEQAGVTLEAPDKAAGDLADVAEPAADSTGLAEPAEAEQPEGGDAGTAVPAVDTAPSPADPAGSGRYLVQVASFSATGNATRLSGRLREQGLPVVMDTVDSVAGTLHRVRIGPFGQRQQADEAIAALNRHYPDLSPRVLDLRPGDDVQVTEPSDPMVHWVVQLGSFAETDNAEALVLRLRDGGYSAFSVAVSGDAGTIHKVRVGPVVEREEAVRLSSVISSEFGIDGLVMSAD